MTDPGDTVATQTPPGAAATALTGRRRRVLRGCLWGAVLGVPLLLAIALGALWLRLAAGPLALPQVLQSRIEAQLDAGMAMNRLSLGEIAIALPEGDAPEVALRDITLTDADGAVRAAFPELRVAVSASALLQGAVHPTRIEIAGAGIRLSRDAEGGLDLEFTQGAGATLSLEETLERVDAMFETPEFAALEAITGTGLTLAMADAMTGQVMWVRDGRMRLERKDGALTLTMGGALEGSRDARLDLAITRDASQAHTDLGMTFTNVAARDLATASPALSWLDLMRAPITGQMAARLADDGTVGDLSGRLQIGAGQFSVEGVDAPLSFREMAADFAYDAETGRIGFDLLQIDAPELSFSAEGHADVAPDGTVYTGQFRLSGIEADPRGLFPAPIILDGAAVDLRLTLAPDLLIEIGQAVLFDGALQAHARAEIRSNAFGLHAAVDARIAEIDGPSVLGYWPVDAVPNTRRWLAQNVEAARLSGVDFALRVAPEARPRLALDFDFTDARVRVLPHLPPIENGIGYLSLIGPRLVLRLDDGDLAAPDGGAVALDGSSFVIEDTRPRGPDAGIGLEVEGGMTDVLRLLSLPPVNLFATGDLTPESLGTGQAELSARIETRLLRGQQLSDIDFEVGGVLRDVRAADLVPGRLLAADELRVTVRPDAVAIGGQATLDGVRFSGQWGRPLGPGTPPGSRVEARATLDRASLAEFGVTLPNWMISGRGQADLIVDLAPDTSPILTASSDLQGIGLALPQLGWRMGQGQSGDLNAVVRLGPSPEVTELSLNGGGLTFEGRAELADGTLRRIPVERLRIGTWLDVAGVLTGRGRGAPLGVEVTGGVLDLRGAPQAAGAGAGSGGGGTAPVVVTLDRLQVTDGISLTALQAELSSALGLSGQFRGRVNGGAPVSGTLITTATGPAVRVRAEDGGHVLRSAGLFDNVHGGEMELILGATGAEGSYEGQLTMSSPRLRDAPAMAELLNLISVVGLLEQLGGEGINLGDVEARFTITPQQIRVTRGSAVGPSMGLSMDGAYNVAARQFDMQGVISPLYVVNGFFGALFAPRREGLFGFSYRLTGTPENTSVAVNPLSILTPGVFREIFRRPPPAPPETE